MKNKNGFTLIEMLVVVLIIGILAAIALPQYQRTKAKAELTQLISVVKPYAEAQERYFLANNKYSEERTTLDIEFRNTDFYCEIKSFWVYCQSQKFIFLIFLQQNHYASAGQMWCGTRKLIKHSKYDNVCKDMFPQAQDITAKMSGWVEVRKGWRIR